ncbi:hypothetical protein POVCU2_0012530 [Plasmodium ovale curtisi]|uniref:Uncharacterized protein n=1 Tax=Plasmodium ovale curtisi TaxID=864141 RepID=A0A1A8VMR2_PLAOA|nr:hypothetical protein POVCU2_0012530 [Plasmodium ovale curtisi]SBS84849.1 hypothetical protein POVCU1_011560 [Plasmodium ovale curtisi]
MEDGEKQEGRKKRKEEKKKRSGGKRKNIFQYALKCKGQFFKNLDKQKRRCKIYHNGRANRAEQIGKNKEGRTKREEQRGKNKEGIELKGNITFPVLLLRKENIKHNVKPEIKSQ